MNLSEGEKLIICMLAEMMKAQGVDEGVDPDFVLSAVTGGQSWALKWQYPGVFDTSETSEDVVRETGDILSMCSVVEYSISRLSATDLAQIPPVDRTVFVGFDGNHDEHFGVASMFVHKMERWSEYKTRSLNSHGTVLPKYRRMLAAFDHLRGPNPLPLAAIQTILAA